MCPPQVLTSLQKQLQGERRRAVAAEEALSEFQAQQGAWGPLLHQLLRDVQQQQRQQSGDPVLEVTGGALLHQLLRDVQQQQRQQSGDPVLEVTGGALLRDVQQQQRQQSEDPLLEVAGAEGPVGGV